MWVMFLYTESQSILNLAKNEVLTSPVLWDKVLWNPIKFVQQFSEKR